MSATATPGGSPELVSAQLLYDRLETIVRRIGMRSRLATALLPLRNLEERFDEIATECIDLQKEVLNAQGDQLKLLDLKKQVVRSEGRFASVFARLSFLPTFFFVYLGFGALFFLVRAVDWPAFVRTTLGVEAPERLVTLGIAGAFLYLATSILKNLEAEDAGDRQLRKVIDFTLRLTLAIIVPIVLVVLFFKKDGTLGDVTVTPELLSFACGYSAKLVMDVFNKIVEKGSKMVEAI